MGCLPLVVLCGLCEHLAVGGRLTGTSSFKPLFISKAHEEHQHRAVGPRAGLSFATCRTHRQRAVAACGPTLS